MTRVVALSLTLLLLAAGCAPMDAPSSQAASQKVPPATAQSLEALPPPLLGTTGSSLNGDGNTHEVCLQQCEHSFSICMDGSAARSDTTSGTMYESRMFGPASRCEKSLASCMSRCSSTASKSK